MGKWNLTNMAKHVANGKQPVKQPKGAKVIAQDKTRRPVDFQKK